MSPCLAYPAYADLPIELEVKEDETAYTVRAEMPGVRRQDIEIAVRGDEVLLRAEAPCMASRSFLLPTKVDPRGAEVELNDGVLTLTLPKRTDTSGNKVVLEFQPPALHMGRAGAYPALSQP